MMENLRSEELQTRLDAAQKRISDLEAEVELLREAVDEIAVELPEYWANIIGPGPYKPYVVKHLRHLHPKMIEPVFEMYRGTEAADVMVGLMFSCMIATNRASLMADRYFYLSKEFDGLTDPSPERLEAMARSVATWLGKSWEDVPDGSLEISGSPVFGRWMNGEEFSGCRGDLIGLAQILIAAIRRSA